MNYPNKLAPIMQPPNGFPPSREDPYVLYIDACRAKYGSCVYPIDRFAEVFQIEDNVWATQLAPPTNIGGNWAYLIEGPEKALLIDNGWGVGNHRGLAESLVHGKPVLAAVTHNHPDHAQGSHQWDEVYCHEYCADVINYNLDHDGGWFGNSLERKDGGFVRPIFKDEDVIPFHRFKPIGLKNHECINLGEDYDIELIHMGGHAPGLSCYLDKKGRRLYTGDAVFETLQDGLGTGLDLRSTAPIPHAEYMDVRYFYEQLKALADRQDEYDFCGDGHGSMDSDKRVVSDLRDAIAAVMEDPYAYTKKIETVFGTGYIMQRGIANCRYSDPATVLELPTK